MSGKLAANCEFHDTSQEIKSAIIQHCLSKRLRRYALREEELTLDKLIAKARSLEISETQATGIEETLQPSNMEEADTINVVKPKPCKEVQTNEELFHYVSQVWSYLAAQGQSVSSQRLDVQGV